jgi:hypothetical protein
MNEAARDRLVNCLPCSPATHASLGNEIVVRHSDVDPAGVRQRHDFISGAGDSPRLNRIASEACMIDKQPTQPAAITLLNVPLAQNSAQNIA